MPTFVIAAKTSNKRKPTISPNTKKELAATSKFRKNEGNSQLPTGELDDQFEDAEDLDDVLDFETAKNSPTKKVPLQSKPISLITLEIKKCNNVIFDGIISKEERKKFWLELGKKIEDLRQISFKRQTGRPSQIIYKLREEAPITDLFKKSDFEIERPNSSGKGTDTYDVTLIDFVDVEVELGKVITVTAFKTIHLEPQDIAVWLELYGFIQGNIRSDPLFSLSRFHAFLIKSHLRTNPNPDQ